LPIAEAVQAIFSSLFADGAVPVDDVILLGVEV
jgi:hypothetical protein